MANKPKSAGMHRGPGFRVRLDMQRPSTTLTGGLAAFPTPDISDLLNRLYAVDARIHCLTPETPQLCGPACTVRVFPGDNLMVHKVLDVVQPGDVVIIDAGASPSNAVLGDIICTKASHRGIAGFIVDGMVRDLSGIKEVKMPVFARGTTPVGPLHRGPGEINYPIACGGIVTSPGDIVVADADGIVIVPANVAGELLDRLIAQRASSESYLKAVQRGEFSNVWVDELLNESDCPLIHQELPATNFVPQCNPLEGRLVN